MNSIFSYVITFSSGLLIGIFGSFFANRLSDKAKDKDMRKAEMTRFRDAKNKMPDLIREMKSDLTGSSMETCREFFISPSKRAVFNPGRPTFLYHENEHDNLVSKVRILENLGFVLDITEGSTPKYQFDEKFVDFLINDEE